MAAAAIFNSDQLLPFLYYQSNAHQIWWECCASELPDDDDVNREIRNLFVRTNILARRYGKCSTSVKLVLFRAYCMCLYDVGLCRHYSITVFNKLRSCHNKCVKIFFGFTRRYSVTEMLAELNLTSLDSLYNKCVNSFKYRISVNLNALVMHLNSLNMFGLPLYSQYILI